MQPDRVIRIGIVAGETSGDRLGAGLIRAVRARVPHARFVGVGGPRMVAAGLEQWHPLDRLAVIGLVEVLRHLPGLLRFRRELAQRFLDAGVDLFVGVDAPDFNLGLARRLKERGIPTLHYVSPTVWAWRKGRTRTVARSVDAVLALFPFESDCYRGLDVAVRYVGHPIADELPLTPDTAAARAALGLGAGPVIALLPGSRVGEMERLAPDFLRSAAFCLARRPELTFLAPMAGPAVRRVFEAALADLERPLPVTVTDGGARQALTAADAALVASGTATMEAALLKCPTVVGYRVAPLSYALFRRLIKVPYVAMPNVLAGSEVMPEFLQDALQPEAVGQALLRLLDDRGARAAMTERFEHLHRELRQGADERAADAVLEWLPAVGRRAEEAG